MNKFIAIMLITNGLFNSGLHTPDGSSKINLSSSGVSSFEITFDRPIEKAMLIGIRDKIVAYNNNKLLVYGLNDSEIRRGNILKIYTKRPNPQIVSALAASPDAEEVEVAITRR